MILNQVLNAKISDRLAESTESVSSLQGPPVNGLPEGTTSLAGMSPLREGQCKVGNA